MKKFCLALDLVDDPESIKEYEDWHKPGVGWKEVRQNDLDAGITNIEIYRTGNRMFMILETNDDFSFEGKKELDANCPKVLEWEELMWKYQQSIPWAKPGEKWVLMEKIFQFEG
ncbi:MAG: L-rhamnose mutarotase [Chitinophagaceae bacterium]|nr:L-rhamnose mutarotase [Chitinophagaceae bacterium]MCW5926756.1 L-rhamnose mutarotase [Chitinophagaceae bacterium]